MAKCGAPPICGAALLVHSRRNHLLRVKCDDSSCNSLSHSRSIICFAADRPADTPSDTRRENDILKGKHQLRVPSFARRPPSDTASTYLHCTPDCDLRGMPHATTTGTGFRDTQTQHEPGYRPSTSERMSSVSASNGLEKFPDLDLQEVNARVPSPQGPNGNPSGPPPQLAGQWQPRKDPLPEVPWRGSSAGQPTRTYGHTRQKSLGEALRTIRTRSGSTSQNVHEIADALKAPISPKLVVCANVLIDGLVPCG